MTATGSHVFLVAQRAQGICVHRILFCSWLMGLSDHNVDSGALPLEVPDDRAIGLNIK